MTKGFAQCKIELLSRGYSFVALRQGASEQKNNQYHLKGRWFVYANEAVALMKNMIKNGLLPIGFGHPVLKGDGS